MRTFSVNVFQIKVVNLLPIDTVCVCTRGTAGEPAQIKCTLNGSSAVKLGQKVEGDIQVNVKDKHGNEIKKV